MTAARVPRWPRLRLTTAHFLAELCCIGGMLWGGYNFFASLMISWSLHPGLGNGRCPEPHACNSSALLFLNVNLGGSIIAAVGAVGVVAGKMCGREGGAPYRVLYWFGTWVGVLVLLLQVLLIVGGLHGVVTDPPRERSDGTAVAAASPIVGGRRALDEAGPAPGMCGTMPNATLATPSGCCAGNFDNILEPDFPCPHPKHLLRTTLVCSSLCLSLPLSASLLYTSIPPEQVSEARR